MKIIINADDFGISQEVNSAIQNALEGNWISSATILAGSKYVEQAAEMCAGFRRASFGAHLALDGPYNVGMLDNSIITAAKFDAATIRHLKFCNISIINDIADEHSRQIEKLLKLGVNVSHVDTHHHLHLYLPALFGLVKAARRHNILKIRNLRLPVNQSIAKRAYRELNSLLIKATGFVSPDCYCSFPAFKQLPASYTAEKTIEIMCHPAAHYNDEYHFDSEFYDTHLQGKIISYHDL